MKERLKAFREKEFQKAIKEFESKSIFDNMKIEKVWTNDKKLTNSSRIWLKINNDENYTSFYCYFCQA